MTMNNCPTCGASESNQGDHFQVAHYYQKETTNEPGGCMAILGMTITATYGAVLIVEDENGVFGIPPMATIDGYHEVDISTWIHNMEKAYDYRLKHHDEVRSRVLRPRLYVPGSMN